MKKKRSQYFTIVLLTLLIIIWGKILNDSHIKITNSKHITTRNTDNNPMGKSHEKDDHLEFNYSDPFYPDERTREVEYKSPKSVAFQPINATTARIPESISQIEYNGIFRNLGVSIAIVKYSGSSLLLKAGDSVENFGVIEFDEDSLLLSYNKEIIVIPKSS